MWQGSYVFEQILFLCILSHVILCNRETWTPDLMIKLLIVFGFTQYIWSLSKGKIPNDTYLSEIPNDTLVLVEKGC